MAVQYRLEFTDDQVTSPITWRLDIDNPNYVGNIVELKGTGQPIVINKQNTTGDKLFGFRSTELIFNFYVESALISSGITDMVTAEEQTYKGLLYKNGVLDFSGWVQPDKRILKDMPYPRPNSLTITDGLSRLTSEFFELDDTAVAGDYKTLVELIAKCLASTGLELAINAYIQLSNNADADLTQGANFFDRNKRHEATFIDEQRRWSYLEVLNDILYNTNCVLSQQSGVWWIVRPIDFLEPSLVFPTGISYDKDGVETGTFSPASVIATNSIGGANEFEQIRPYKNVSVKFIPRNNGLFGRLERGVMDGYIQGGLPPNFEFIGAVNSGNIDTVQGGSARPTNTYKFRVTGASASGTLADPAVFGGFSGKAELVDEVPYISDRRRLYFGISYFIERQGATAVATDIQVTLRLRNDDLSTVYWLGAREGEDEESPWVSEATYNAGEQNLISVPVEDVQKWLEVEFIAEPVPVGAENFRVELWAFVGRNASDGSTVNVQYSKFSVEPIFYVNRQYYTNAPDNIELVAVNRRNYSYTETYEPTIEEQTYAIFSDGEGAIITQGATSNPTDVLPSFLFKDLYSIPDNRNTGVAAGLPLLAIAARNRMLFNGFVTYEYRVVHRGDMQFLGGIYSAKGVDDPNELIYFLADTVSSDLVRADHTLHLYQLPLAEFGFNEYEIEEYITKKEFATQKNNWLIFEPEEIDGPINLTATADTDSIVLDWDNQDTLDGYEVERKTSSTPFVVIEPSLGNVETYDDTTALVGVTYTYRVRGFNNITGGGKDYSPYSNEASATIVDTIELIPNGFNDTVNSITKDASLDYYASGQFTQYGGFDAGRLVKITPVTFAKDNSFLAVPGFDTGDIFHDLASNRLIAGGSFNSWQLVTTPARVMGITPAGIRDTAFNNGGAGLAGASSGGLVQKVYTSPHTGKVYVGVGFTGGPTYNGTAVGRLFRLNTDGTLDTTFGPVSFTKSGSSFTPFVRGILERASGEVFCTGSFDNVNGIAVRANICKLSSTGVLNTTFSVSASGGLEAPGTGVGVIGYDIILAGDGTILVCGFFTEYAGSPAVGVVKISPTTGLINGTFNTSVGPFYTPNSRAGFVYTMDVINGYLVVVGSFDSWNSDSNVRHFAALDISTAALKTDELYSLNQLELNGSVRDFVMEGPDVNRRYVMVGDFEDYNGQPTGNIIIINDD